MAAATVTLGLRPPRFGPALRRSRVPYGSLAVSVVAHMVLMIAVIVAAVTWRPAANKTYVVNLVPAVAALGTPRPEPALPPRAADVTPPAPKPKAAELPAPREQPPPREMPPRDMPPRDMPPRTAALPDRALPPRAPALPRPGDKELPNVASATKPVPTPAPTQAPPTPAPREAPPSSPPLGTATGSPQGAGTVTLNVADFPYAWYIQAIHRKIQERWEGRAIEGRQPEIIFEIERNGRLRRVMVGKTSGNSAYDQLAMRAISEANPFPELPQGFEKPTLTVGLQFIYDPRTR